MARRIQQLGSAVIDLQRKLNHEIKEREIDENALSNRYEEFHSAKCIFRAVLLFSFSYN